MRVATFNLHAGVDGWGRPTNALHEAVALGADIMVVPETWRGDEGPDFVAALERETGFTVVFTPLARAERRTNGRGSFTWQPLSAHLTGELGLLFTDHRAPTRAQRRRHRRLGPGEPGTWGLGLVSRFPLTEVEVVELGRLPRERVRRAVITATAHTDEGPVTVLALHGAHLSHGSFRQYRKVNALAATKTAYPLVLVGDFNSWRPVLRLILPGWRTLARGRTWPARIPHSQIDHVLGRGPWRTVSARTVRGGSDHRALVADLTLVTKGLG